MLVGVIFWRKRHPFWCMAHNEFLLFFLSFCNFIFFIHRFGRTRRSYSLLTCHLVTTTMVFGLPLSLDEFDYGIFSCEFCASFVCDVDPMFVRFAHTNLIFLHANCDFSFSHFMWKNENGFSGVGTHIDVDWTVEHFMKNVPHYVQKVVMSWRHRRRHRRRRSFNLD